MNSQLAPVLSPTPTTHILAIGMFPSDPTPEQFMTIRPLEVPATVRLYLAGKISQWFTRKDRKGVVFLMNVTTVEEAHQLLEQLPFGVAGLMKFDLIPVGPLAPLEILLGAGPPAVLP
jgi:hypothetical protein